MQTSSDSITRPARSQEACEASSRFRHVPSPGGERVYALEYVQDFPRRREEVFRFFEDAFNLDTITPPLLRFRILTPRPIHMRSGALIDYRLRVRGVPVRWRTRIEEYEPPHRFVDRQVRGLYRLWRHEHTFEEIEGGTRMTDRVVYITPLAGTWLGSILHDRLVRPDLESIFCYRRAKLAALLGEFTQCESDVAGG